MIVQFSSAAIADLGRVRDFLQATNPTASGAAVEAVVAGAFALADLPFRAPAIANSGDRRLAVPFGRAAYLVDYRVGRETVTILRIRHSREAR